MHYLVYNLFGKQYLTDVKLLTLGNNLVIVGNEQP